MIIVDVVLVAAVAALIATNLRDRRLLRENQRLLSQNSTISEYMLESSPTEDGERYQEHVWSLPQEDTIFISKSLLSYDRVITNISYCEKCRLVHRCIVGGWTLARKKGLLDVEGFYHSGIKVPNKGCMPDLIDQATDITLEDSDVVLSKKLG